jgi:hypothetical protein
LEEDKSPHLSSAPPFDESETPANTPVSTTVPDASLPNASTANSNQGASGQDAPARPQTEATNPPPVTNQGGSATPKPKSWWQKLLEWIGME